MERAKSAHRALRDDSLTREKREEAAISAVAPQMLLGASEIEGAMAETIRLTVLRGPHKDRRYCFCGVTSCVLGRANDCFIRLAGMAHDENISRHHCQLDIAPPVVRLRDLGSLNGTFLNGSKVPVSQSKGTGPARFEEDPTSVAVDDTDIITIGGTPIQVHIVDCPPRRSDGTRIESVWQPGEVAMKDCPIPCTCDGLPIGSLPVAVGDVAYADGN
jgi:hypothetical protein